MTAVARAVLKRSFLVYEIASRLPRTFCLRAIRRRPALVWICANFLLVLLAFILLVLVAGLALIRQDRPAEAAQEFRSELQLAPQDADAQFHLAFVLLQMSQNGEAAQLLRNVLAHKPEHPEANYELGKELMSEGKPADAIPYLETAARLKPQFEPVHYQLQSAYRTSGRKEDADREARIYKDLKAKSRNITLPPPPEQGSDSASHNQP